MTTQTGRVRRVRSITMSDADHEVARRLAVEAGASLSSYLCALVQRAAAERAVLAPPKIEG